MATINLIRPELPWTKLDEEHDGDWDNQFECANPSDPGLQLTAVEVGGRPALRLLVDSGSQYGNSTWLRALGRLTAPDDLRFVEGSRVAVAKRVVIPAGQILDGATVIDEAHGPGGDVAPVRLIVRRDGNLYASFNGGTKVGAGYTGWTKEQLVGPFTLGIEHELVYSILFHRDPSVGRLTVSIDGKTTALAGATGQVVNGAWQHPYLLSGIYVGSASTPVVCFIRGIAVADTVGEALTGLDGILADATVPPEPETTPPVEYATAADLAALRTALDAYQAAALDAGANRDTAIAALGSRVNLLERQTASVYMTCKAAAAKASLSGKQLAAAIANAWPR